MHFLFAGQVLRVSSRDERADCVWDNCISRWWHAYDLCMLKPGVQRDGRRSWNAASSWMPGGHQDLGFLSDLHVPIHRLTLWLWAVLAWALFSFQWPCLCHTVPALPALASSPLSCFLTELKGMPLMINMIWKCLQAAVGLYSEHGFQKDVLSPEQAWSLLSREQRWWWFAKRGYV